MGKVKVMKSGPMSTIQDFGRYGYRKFGVPQSGAMDKELMIAANQLVGNTDDSPVIEFVMTGMELEILALTTLAVTGASLSYNGVKTDSPIELRAGDSIKIDPPNHVYGYLAIAGKLKAKSDFGSVSTYPLAGFGGLDGGPLKANDVLETSNALGKARTPSFPDRTNEQRIIRIMKGPEWHLLKELPDAKNFSIDSTSNRMGIRLNGTLDCDYREIASSAVIPGTIQLPANGQPIVLMNDCQTTGGYPRIGKVLDKDLGKLAQLKSKSTLILRLVN